MINTLGLSEATQTASMLIGSGAVIAFLFRLLILSKDREFAGVLKQRDDLMVEEQARHKSYEDIATEAVRVAKETVDFYRMKENKPPVPVLVPVVPESHSPSTAVQRDAAKIQTLRATLAAIAIEVERPPRAHPDQAPEKDINI